MYICMYIYRSATPIEPIAPASSAQMFRDANHNVKVLSQLFEMKLTDKQIKIKNPREHTSLQSQYIIIEGLKVERLLSWELRDHESGVSECQRAVPQVYTYAYIHAV